MKRLQIMIEEDLDEAPGPVGRPATAIQGVADPPLRTRGAQSPATADQDPLTAMIGADDAEPASIDDVVYR